MKFVFHLGMPKCGTSTFQNVCARNRSLLGEHGVLYPDFTRFHDTYSDLRHRSTGNGNPFVYLVRARSDPEVAPTLKAADVFAHFQDQMSSGVYHTVVISHEDLCGFSPAVLLEMADDLGASPGQLHFFLHIRPHDQWLASDYQQHVKQLRTHHSLSRHIGSRLRAAEFSKVCDRYARAVGVDRMHVRLLDRDVIRTNIVHDFFDVLGNDISEIRDIPIPASNEGIDMAYLEILRAANARGVSAKQFHGLLNFYDKFRADSNSRLEGRIVLDAAQAELVHAFCKADRDALGAYLSEKEMEILHGAAQKANTQPVGNMVFQMLDFLSFALKNAV